MTSSLQQIIETSRKRLIALHYHAKAGHLGGALSAIEAMITLHHDLMQPDDRFILSKGHNAGLLYVTLWSKGLISDDELATYAQEGTRLPSHPSGSGIPELLFPTGSLGHGPSLASGLALAARHACAARHIWCLCSDGEWQEGSCWEALIFAVHNKLDNLTILVDQNGLQAFGTTEEVASIADLTPRFLIFGADAVLVDGQNPDAIIHACRAPRHGVPRIVVLNTTKGRGLTTENTVACHYLAPTDAEYAKFCSVL